LRIKRYDFIILAVICVLAGSLAYSASYTIHDMVTGIMHDAKDIYRTNTRSVENDIASNEVRIAGLQTEVDSDEAALLADIVNLATNYYTAAAVSGYLALKANVADVYSIVAVDLLLLDKATTAAVALKADQTEVDSIEAALLASISNLASNYWTAVNTKAYVDGTDEVQAASIALKANSADVNTTGEISLLLADKADTDSVYSKGAADILLGAKADSSALADHTGEVSGAHQGSAIAIDSSGFVGNLSLADNTTQKALAKLDGLSGLPATNAITKIYGDSDIIGCDTGAVWLAGTNGVTIYRSGNTFELNIDSATKFNSYTTLTATSQEVAVHNDDSTNVHGIADTIALATKAQTSEEVAVHNEDANAHLAKFAAIPLATAIEDTAIFISSNVFEFSDDFDTSAVVIYRNGIMQPRRLFTTEDVSSKTRVTFISAVNDSDEIILISNK